MQRFAGYALRERIHEGLHAVVYRGVRISDRAPVVVKLLKSEYPSSHEIARLRHEYSIARSLDCDGVVKAYALERHDRRLAIIFEDLGDDSLASLLLSRRLPLRMGLQIAASIAGILGEIHHRHVIHRDIKPHNIIVNPETCKATLIDLGTALFHGQNPRGISQN